MAANHISLEKSLQTKFKKKVESIKERIKVPKKDKDGKTIGYTTKAKTSRGVVYLSCIPHGFYEKAMEKYFGQFGKVTGINVPRSKSGKAKGFAFIEFQYSEVAQVVADTMNNYLMFNRLIKAKYIPPNEQKPYLFEGNRPGDISIVDKKMRALRASIVNRRKKNKKLSPEGEAKFTARASSRLKALKAKLKRLGLDYDFQVEFGEPEGKSLEQDTNLAAGVRSENEAKLKGNKSIALRKAGMKKVKTR